MQSENRYIYLKVTSDEYELPVDFDMSPTKLGKRHGSTGKAVRAGAYYTEKGQRKSMWRRVRADEVY